MCNVEDDGERAPVRKTSQYSTNGRKCVKCDNPGVLVIRIHDSFCKECFRVYIVHKFRSAIGKSKLIRDGDQVLVAFSGGINSAALLNLISDGLSERAHKKLRFTPTVLYVDECTVLNFTKEERKSTLQEVSSLVHPYGFPFHIVPIEQGLTMERCNEDASALTVWDASEASLEGFESQIPSDTLQNALKSIVRNLASLTSKENFVKNLRNQLIISVARKMGFIKVMTAESSTQLSIQVLADISQGRGSQVSLDTSFSDTRNGDVMILRPVRDLNAKELAMYNRLFSVKTVVIPTLSTKTPAMASIEKLTEAFVTGLHADFPSTVSNIVRTSEKLHKADAEHKCSFCQSAIDSDPGSASAVKAIHFSKMLSRGASHAPSPSTCGQSQHLPSNNVECCGQGDGSCGRTSFKERPSYDEVLSSLCFGCQLTLRDFDGDVSSLPSFLQSDVSKQKQREKLRQEIAEFLLDDSDS